jgi:hypothetical protein
MRSTDHSIWAYILILGLPVVLATIAGVLFDLQVRTPTPLSLVLEPGRSTPTLANISVVRAVLMYAVACTAMNWAVIRTITNEVKVSKPASTYEVDRQYGQYAWASVGVPFFALVPLAVAMMLIGMPPNVRW